MTEFRHYPPAAIIHVPHCSKGRSLPAVPIASVAEAVPNHDLHLCFPLEMKMRPISEIEGTGIFPVVKCETPIYPVHPYDPDKDGPQLPPDAIDYPCRVCRGTHGEDRNGLHDVSSTSTGVMP